MGNFLSGKPSRLLAGDNEGPLSGQDDAGVYEPPISLLEPHPGGPRGVDEGPVQLELLGPAPLGPRLPAAVPRPTAAERVAQLAEGGLRQIERERYVTLAVTETKEGVRIISSSRLKVPGP